MNSLGVLGVDATGSIEPDLESEYLSEVKERVASGEYNRPVDHSVACGCIDGRCGGSALHVSSAGGTIGLAVANDLSQYSFGQKLSTGEMLMGTIMLLESRGAPIGGHCDDHSSSAMKTGCGANDNLQVIYANIVSKQETVRSIATRMFGSQIDESTHAKIINNASERSEFSNPSLLLQIVKDSQNSSVDTLKGNHHEVVIAVNRRIGTTLDHHTLSIDYGDEYQAFNVDVWAFEESARSVANNPNDQEEVNAIVVALAYYNIATALTLCGPDMEGIVVE